MKLFKSISFTKRWNTETNYLHLNGSTRFIVLFLGFVFSSVSAPSLVAQTAASLESITTDAYTSADTQWKSYSNYNAVIASELLITAEALNAPNISSKELALYNGYNKMLNYMQVDIAGKVSIETVAENNFKKVLADVATDIALADLPKSEFTSLYANLLVKLITN
jgi:hypothetical protein